MKKIVIYSGESFFGGIVNCGIAEVVDSLANSLTEQYDVSVICPQGDITLMKSITDLEIIEEGVKKGQILKVKYFLIQKTYWPEKSYQIIDKIKPDILHNFEDPDLILSIQKPKKIIYTFDNINDIKNKKSLKFYDYIASPSKSYTEEILNGKDSIYLKDLNIAYTSIGILDELFNPEKGLFLPYAFDSNNLEGKDKCKKRLLEKYNKKDACIFLFLARMVKEKGLEQIIESIETITDSNNLFIIIGIGEEKYENYFLNLSKEKNNVLFINKRISPAQAVSFLGAADFYLQPSLIEPGGIMPMTASCYGAIPIITLNGGLKDNFNENNSIIVENGLEEALQKAISLYQNKIKIQEKRKKIMKNNFSWNIRKNTYINLYEN